jgi:hypothetical protein
MLFARPHPPAAIQPRVLVLMPDAYAADFLTRTFCSPTAGVRDPTYALGGFPMGRRGIRVSGMQLVENARTKLHPAEKTYAR